MAEIEDQVRLLADRRFARTAAVPTEQIRPAESADHPIESEPDEGDLIVVDIQTIETGTGREDEEDRRRWLPYTILAAAAVLVVIVAVAVFDGTEESTPLDVVDSPVDVDAPEPTEQVTPEPTDFGAESSSVVVDDYFASFEAGDIDALIALFSPGTELATTFCLNGTNCIARTGKSLEFLEQLLAYKSAEGTIFIDPSCAPADEPFESDIDAIASSSATGLSVRCEYVEHGGVAQAVAGPTLSVVATFIVSADGIDSVNRQIGSRYLTDTPFGIWLRSNHPEDDIDATICCEGWDSVEDARQSGLSAAQYADEWAAFLEENGCVYDDVFCGRNG